MKLALVCLFAIAAVAYAVPISDDDGLRSQRSADPPSVSMRPVKAAPKKPPPIICRKDDQACIDKRAGKAKRSAEDKPQLTFRKLQMKPEMPIMCMKDDVECNAKLEAQKQS